MAIINCAECGNAFSDKAPACPHCGCPIEFAKPQSAVNEPSANTGSVENDSKKALLREYLEKIRLLETDIYTMNQLIPELRNTMRDPSSAEEIPHPVKPREPDPPIAPTLDTDFYDLDKKYKHWYNFYKRMYPYNPLKVRKLAMEERDNCAQRNDRKRELNEQSKRKYQEDLKDYNEKVLPQYEKEMLEYKRQMDEHEVRIRTARAQVDLYNQGIDNQILLVVTERNRAQETLQALYDTGIIFPKYRGIVPVTMFCEYMDSGRRTTLEGVDGMYDLYESELLGKRIVESIGEVNTTLRCVNYRLGGIANQLTGIARNQIMLHEEIAKGNAISARISADTSKLLENSASMLSATGEIHDELSSISKTIKATEENTAAAAYSAEVAARRVDAIAKIEEYEYSLRHPSFPSV